MMQAVFTNGQQPSRTDELRSGLLKGVIPDRDTAMRMESEEDRFEAAREQVQRALQRVDEELSALRQAVRYTSSSDSLLQQEGSGA